MAMPKALWLLLIGMVINTTGSSFLWPLNTIYIHDILGHSLSFAGFILMLNSGAGIIGNLYGGVLFDRIGGYKSIVIGLLVTTISGIILAFYHTTLPYSLLLVTIGFGSGMVFPSMYAMAGSVWPEGGRKPFNALYVAQNLGVALGSSLGGLVASISFTMIFAVNGFLFLCFTVFAFLTYKDLIPKHIIKNIQTNIIEQSAKIKLKGPFAALVILCIGYVICWIAYVQWQTTIASYTQSLHIPVSHYSLLWTVNGLLIVLGQPLVSIVTKKIPSSKAQILLGIGIFTCSFILLTSVVSFTGLLVCMMILTSGEMLVWPAVPTVANELAPQGRAGFYQGFVNSSATCGRMIGPLFGGIIVDIFSMHVLFVILIIIYFGAAFTSLIYDRPIREKTKNIIKAS